MNQWGFTQGLTLCFLLHLFRMKQLKMGFVLGEFGRRQWIHIWKLCSANLGFSFWWQRVWSRCRDSKDLDSVCVCAMVLGLFFFLFGAFFFFFFEWPRARQLECLAEMSVPLNCLLASLHLESVEWDRHWNQQNFMFIFPVQPFLLEL